MANSQYSADSAPPIPPSLLSKARSDATGARCPVLVPACATATAAKACSLPVCSIV